MFQPRLRLITIGDEKVGKTWLTHMLCDKDLPEQYTPTTYENFCFDKIINGQMVTFSLRDTAGRPSLDEFRSICFGGADVFLLCYASNDRESFINLQEKWIPYSRSKVPDAKLILVETKLDFILPNDFLEENFPQHFNNEKCNSSNNVSNVLPNFLVKEPSSKSSVKLPQIQQDQNPVPLFNLNAKESSIEKFDHPRISIPKSARAGGYPISIATARSTRARSPVRLNTYLPPNVRSIAELNRVQGKALAPKRHGKIPVIIENPPQTAREPDNLITKSKSEPANLLSPRFRDFVNSSKKKTQSTIVDIPEIPEIDRVITQEDINRLSMEEDIIGYIRCSAKLGIQSQSIFEFVTKACILKKRWTPPFRRSQKK